MRFGAGLTAPDFTLELAICTLSASCITGTSPAFDTRLSSSNTAHENSNHPSSEGIVMISTPRLRSIWSVDRG